MEHDGRKTAASYFSPYLGVLAHINRLEISQLVLLGVACKVCSSALDLDMYRTPQAVLKTYKKYMYILPLQH